MDGVLWVAEMFGFASPRGQSRLIESFFAGDSPLGMWSPGNVSLGVMVGGGELEVDRAFGFAFSWGHSPPQVRPFTEETVPAGLFARGQSPLIKTFFAGDSPHAGDFGWNAEAGVFWATGVLGFASSWGQSPANGPDWKFLRIFPV